MHKLDQPIVGRHSFDPIHDPQQMFRVLLDTMARPGTIGSIEQYLDRNGEFDGFEAVATSLAYTLLDREVRFMQMQGHSTHHQSMSDWERTILRKTYARCVTMEQADYVFAWTSEVLGNARNLDLGLYTVNEWIQAVDRDARRGTLTRPDQSTTLLFGVAGFNDASSPAIKLTLRGPGIETECTILVNGMSPRWLEAREQWNIEFPKGMDWVLFTADGRMISLPRSTKLQWEVAAWPMLQ